MHVVRIVSVGVSPLQYGFYRQQTNKTGLFIRSARPLASSRPAVVESIEQIREPERELIWPFDQHISSFYQRYRKLTKMAGLQYTPWKTGPHRMRKSFASYLEAAGGDACKALKHTKLSITEGSYIDPRIAKPRNYSILLPKVEVGQ